MKRLNSAKIRFVFVVFAAAMVLSSGSVKADFTFGEPIHLGPPFSTTYGDGITYVTADGLEMYFDYLNRPGGYDGWDIWVSKRETMDDDWPAPLNLGSRINTGQSDACTYISADGLELYFCSYNRSGGYGSFDIWVTKRATKNDPWDQPINLGSKVNSSAWDSCPSISMDGLELYYASRRSGGYGSDDIWVSRRATKDDPWVEPENLGPVVNSSASESLTFLSSDGLLLFFSEDSSAPIRPGGFGNMDMWVTRRASISDLWGTPVNLGPTVNTSSLDGGPRISPDGTTLYFSSKRPGGLGGSWGDIYQAPIIPLVDFNGDGNIGISDLVIIINNWGQNNPSIDIGPFAWGDGLVDKEDLEVLMKYWGQKFDDPTLIANWKLDETEGTAALDSVGGIEAEVYGDPVWCPADGMVDGALMLDGIDDCVGTWEIPSLSEGDFSIFAWIKGGAPGQVVISEFHGVNWLMADAVTGYLGTDLGEQSLVSSVNITDDNWHRVGLSWDGTNRVLIVNNVAVALDMQRRNLERTEVELNIGCGPNSTSGTFFSGLIDDVRIYNRAITP